MTIYIEKPANGLCIDVHAPLELYQDCKEIPAGRWINKPMVWRYPATPFIAMRLHRLFKELGYKKDKRFHALLAHARSFKKIQAIKETDRRLAPIPLTKVEPWDHQLRAYHYARKMLSCMLALDMGAGKTKVVIDLITNLDLRQVLVVCPAKVIDVWPAQVVKHSARKDVVVLPLKGPQSVKKRTEKANELFSVDSNLYPIRMVIINYESVWREPFASWALEQHWDAVVSDESHRVKAAGSNISRFMFRLGQRADRRLALTGTMAPNSPLDVYGQYRFLDVGIFGSRFDVFRDQYAIMGGFENRQIFGYKNQIEMNKKLHSIAYVVDESVHTSLPPETEMVRTVPMNAISRKLYDKLDKDFIFEIGDSKVTVGNSLTKIGRLQEITSGFTRTDSKTADPRQRDIVDMNDDKAELLTDILEDIATGTPVIVFGRFIVDLQRITAALLRAGWSVGELSGKSDDLKAFHDGKVDSLVVQIQSGKEGIDLTRARYGIFYSYVHSYGDYRQCRKRVRRPGQAFPQTFIHLAIENSIDTEMIAAYETKGNVIEYLINLRRKQ